MNEHPGQREGLGPGTDAVAELIQKHRAELIACCRTRMLGDPKLDAIVKQLHISESEEWLNEALSLFLMCTKSWGPAAEWHDEVGELNFASGLSIGDANELLEIIRDGLLEIVWRTCGDGTPPREDIPSMVRTILEAFDRALAAQASAYVRESQRHLSEVNRKLELRRQMFERDLTLATLVQQLFIPSSFSSRNFRAEVRYIPTTSVGGDHAGIFPVSEDRLYITICDVTGHGIASALVAEMVSSQLRPLLRQQIDAAFQYPVEPVTILRELNNTFHNQFQPIGMLLSFFVALVDCSNETVTYAGAGHPPPILQCCSARNLIELKSQNIILGAAEDCVVGDGQDTLPIHRGDRIIFYTDGIIEASNTAGNMFGIDGLKSVISDNYEVPQTQLADKILAAVRGISKQTDIADDMSLILLDVLDHPEDSPQINTDKH